MKQKYTLESELTKFTPIQMNSFTDKECMPLLTPGVLKERFRDVVCSYPIMNMIPLPTVN